MHMLKSMGYSCIYIHTYFVHVLWTNKIYRSWNQDHGKMHDFVNAT
uniref:Uncharacterized protein n=1 Tax=Rhizophora mucronata TaxID=61149 RepID=A0A2P2J515_RHIMU